MKYEITRKCGHAEAVELYGKVADRESKLNWLKNTVCHNCYNSKDNVIEIEMSYSEYKNKYSHYKTKYNSYDKKNKTIIVYVPQQKEQQSELENNENEVIQEIAKESGYTEEFIRQLIKTGSNKAEEALLIYGEKAKTLPDKSGKFTNAYDAMLYNINLLKKYGY